MEWGSSSGVQSTQVLEGLSKNTVWNLPVPYRYTLAPGMFGSASSFLSGQSRCRCLGRAWATVNMSLWMSPAPGLQPVEEHERGRCKRHAST